MKEQERKAKKERGEGGRKEGKKEGRKEQERKAKKERGEGGRKEGRKEQGEEGRKEGVAISIVMHLYL